MISPPVAMKIRVREKFGHGIVSDAVRSGDVTTFHGHRSRAEVHSLARILDFRRGKDKSRCLPASIRDESGCVRRWARSRPAGGRLLEKAKKPCQALAGDNALAQGFGEGLDLDFCGVVHVDRPHATMRQSETRKRVSVFRTDETCGLTI